MQILMWVWLALDMVTKFQLMTVHSLVKLHAAGAILREVCVMVYLSTVSRWQFAVWLISNGVDCINKVNLYQLELDLGWVTISEY